MAALPVAAAGDAMRGFGQRREEMVERQLAGRGIRDEAVLEAMRAVPREHFVPPELADLCYQDRPLPIGSGQTISQPYIVALMAEALELEGGERVLEVGAGSGYAAAVLARIASEVIAIERHPELAEAARRNLGEAGAGNVRVVHADGSLGLPAEAPYDAILVSAGGPAVPRTLRAQLARGGVLVMPVGAVPREQVLVRITRLGEDDWREERLGLVSFVPLIGEEAWGEMEGTRAVHRRGGTGLGPGDAGDEPPPRRSG